ncbi:putative integral membrane protein (TIGR00698 family) [Parvibaculum indicum]|uniref:YeiH family protein n=1 Tax=Parvibaculum indicum TaxID=562969 RepID=UPI0014249B6F|nr:YeiH family protein [Parvibaculum indicum]NIJ42701.1 putative integral membrane protein (TIGR00698 family) [Parvibaculum indicum]
MSANDAATVAHPTRLQNATALLPGLGLTVLIGAAATGLHELPGMGPLSPLILAILLGMAFNNIVGTPEAARAGVKFSLRRILRFAVMLLGLQLTLAQVESVGLGGIAATLATLGATFFFTLWMGRALGVGKSLSALIASGTSICGASAVIAADAVIGGEDEEVAYAVACVTIFGSISMLLYPILGAAMALTPHAYGLWTGATIHEVAQVVAAAFQGGEAAGHFGTIVKLTRVMMLAPVILALAAFWVRETAHGAPDVAGPEESRPAQSRWAHIPWFAFGFLALILVNTLFPLGEAAKADTGMATTFLLAVAVAAMGLETDFRKLLAMGLRPLILGAAAWIFISVAGLGLVTWLS